MNYYDAVKAAEDAEQTLRMANVMVEKLLPMLPTRLKSINSYRGLQALCDLKRELKDFNMHTKSFK